MADDTALKSLTAKIASHEKPEERLYGHDKIWWLAGYPKSGNTWLRAMLGTYIAGGRANINALPGMHHTDLHPYFYQSVSPKPIEKLTPDEVLLIRPAALFHMVRLYGAGRSHQPLFIKTHSMNDEFGFLLPKCLTHGGIYLVRDPRDVCVSYATHLGKDIDLIVELMNSPTHLLNDAPSPVMQCVNTWSNNIRSWLEPSTMNRLKLRYEDMKADPLGALHDILSFINMEKDEEAMALTIDNTTIEKLRAQEDRFGFTEKKHGDRFFGRGMPGAWKDVLTTKQQEKIEFDHADMMGQMGYI